MPKEKNVAHIADRSVPKKTFHVKDLRPIQPKTKTQEDLFYFYNTGFDVMTLTGSAGVGKTFLSLFLAFRDILDPDSQYKHLKIIRSAVPSRSVGFLPGTLDEKMEVYEKPYENICDELFTYNSRNYERLKELNYVSFDTTSYLRGLTFDNTIVIVDELQNMNMQEIDTIMTRIGVYSKILFCGDFNQNDLLYSKNDQTGINQFTSIIERMNDAVNIEFTLDDCVRSQLVYEYLKAKEEIEGNANRSTNSRNY